MSHLGEAPNGIGKGLEYQLDFSNLHPDSMFDEEGRLQKARKTVAVILDYMRARGLDPRAARVLDIGCSTGILTRHYGDYFGAVVGMDIDRRALAWAREKSTAGNIEFHHGDSMNIPLPDDAFDIVTCTHIYEHVPDAGRLLEEIFRVLRPGGFCLFAAENRLRLMEHHYNLPLLSLVPKWVGHHYVRLTGRGDRFYETHYTLWGLRRFARGFEIYDYTTRVVADPERFEATDVVRPGSVKQRLAKLVMRFAYWASPTYIWILRRPEEVKAEP
ncbi:MAG: methyltransferase domain-containing protein [Thermoanaerobaculales bacterium]